MILGTEPLAVLPLASSIDEADELFPDGVTDRIPGPQQETLTGATVVSDIIFATKQLPKQFRYN